MSGRTVKDLIGLNSLRLPVLRNERGMALLMTLLIVSIIFALTVQFNRAMRTNLLSSRISGESIGLNHLALSAFTFSRAVLLADAGETQSDSLQEEWADSDVLSGYFAEVVGDGAQAVIRINDHSGRIQLNALVTINKDGRQVVNEEVKGLLVRFLSLEEYGLEQEDIDNIVAALIDWLDDDDEVTGFGGAESSYYQGLEQGYSCKNGMIESLKELLFIRWISEELLFGTREKPGILNYLTYLGNDGKININTAAPMVLRGLADQIDQEMVDGMVEYREDEDHGLADPNWYKQAPSFPGDVVIPAALLTTVSSFFEVVTETVAGNVSKKGVGVLWRQGKKTEIVSWETI